MTAIDRTIERSASAAPTSGHLNKLARLRSRFHDAEWRRYGTLLLMGRGLGLVVLFGSMYLISTLIGSGVHAEDAAVPVLKGNDIVNPLNTVWTLVAAFLVFGMQVGFVMLEAGFARSRESVNILVEGIVDTCICGVTFWAWGFAFMFMDGSPWIGTHGFFLKGIPDTYLTTGVPLLAYWVFQFAFADTCSTITSGAMVGRTGFKGDLLYSIGVSGFIYPILGHWVWGPGGWLATMPVPFRDFAGSTVVHTVGGMIALAGAVVLGPRLGRKFRRDGGGMPAGHDMTIAAIGGVILWFGWYGFNPGSTLSALDAGGMGRVATNTTLAAAAGALSALFFVYPRSKKWDTGITGRLRQRDTVVEVGPQHRKTPHGLVALCLGVGGQRRCPVVLLIHRVHTTPSAVHGCPLDDRPTDTSLRMFPP
jgi:Amt family ammonium transporter